MVNVLTNDLECIEINTEEELDVYLKKYDKTNYYEKNKIHLILVPDSFLEDPEELEVLTYLKNKNLEHSFFITESEASKGFDIFKEGSVNGAIAKTDFYNNFHIGASYKC